MQTNKLTPLETKRAFKKILKLKNQLKAMENTDHGGKYYEVEKHMNDMLVAFLRQDFHVLDKFQILQLCALVSTHRPVQLHSFLIYCSSQRDAMLRAKANKFFSEESYTILKRDAKFDQDLQLYFIQLDGQFLSAKTPILLRAKIDQLLKIKKQ